MSGKQNDFEIADGQKLVFEGNFKDAQTGNETSIKTKASITLQDNVLLVDFQCLDNSYTTMNTYTENNSEMWNQEVFEIFIAKGIDVPTEYLEIEVNPNGALFVAWVKNPTGEAPESLVFLDPEEAGVNREIVIGDDQWSGQLQVPLHLLGDLDCNYTFNLFRIAAKTMPMTKNWVCNAENAYFLCQSSTHSGESPRFHRPKYFNKLKIKTNTNQD